MIKRIEFVLNLDDPVDVAIFAGLAELLEHHRASTLIRRALAAFLLESPTAPAVVKREAWTDQTICTTPTPIDAAATSRIVDQSATMFGF